MDNLSFFATFDKRSAAPAAPAAPTELSTLFAPPEELIFGIDPGPDRAALQKLREIGMFSDEKTLMMISKYR